MENSIYKFNIIGHENPIVVPIPYNKSGLVGGSRKKIKFEINDFTWMGTFSAGAFKSLTVDGTDFSNVPPSFFYIKLNNMTDGVFNEKGSNIDIVEFAHPTQSFEVIPSLKGTLESEQNTYFDLNLPGGNIITDWEDPTVNSAVLTFSHQKIVYSIIKDSDDNVDLGNLPGLTFTLEIMANINTLVGRIGSKDPDNPDIQLIHDKFKPQNVLYTFKDRDVVGLGKLTEDYVLRCCIYEEDL